MSFVHRRNIIETFIVIDCDEIWTNYKYRLCGLRWVELSVLVCDDSMASPWGLVFSGCFGFTNAFDRRL